MKGRSSSRERWWRRKSGGRTKRKFRRRQSSGELLRRSLVRSRTTALGARRQVVREWWAVGKDSQVRGKQSEGKREEWSSCT